MKLFSTKYAACAAREKKSKRAKKKKEICGAGRAARNAAALRSSRSSLDVRDDRRGRKAPRFGSRGKGVQRQHASPHDALVLEASSRDAGHGLASSADIARVKFGGSDVLRGKIDAANPNHRTWDSSDPESGGSDAENSSPDYRQLTESSPGCPKRVEGKPKKRPLTPGQSPPARKKSRSESSKSTPTDLGGLSDSDAPFLSGDGSVSDSNSDGGGKEERSWSGVDDDDAASSESKKLRSKKSRAAVSDSGGSDSSGSDSSDASNSDSSSSDSSSSDDDDDSDDDASDDDSDADENSEPNPKRAKDPEWVTTPGGAPAWWTEDIKDWLESTATISGQKKSARRLKRSIHFLIEFMKKHKPAAQRVKKVKPRDLRAWVRQLEEQLRADRIKNKKKKADEYTMTQNAKRAHMIAIKSFWSSLVSNLSVKVNVAMPLKLPPKPQPKRTERFTSDETRNKFLLEAKRNGTVHVCIIGLLLYSGLRVMELVCLKKSDVTMTKDEETRKKQIHLIVREEGAKYEKSRPITLGDNGVKYLWPYLKQMKRMNSKKNEYLFPARWTRKTKGAGHRSTDSVYRMIKNKYSKKFKTEHTPHWLRHAFATTLRRRGQDEKEIQNWMGHKSVKTTRGYIHHDPNAEMRE